MNSLLVAGMAGLQAGTSPLAAWRAGRDFDVLQFGAVYAVGVGLAVAVRSPWGAWGAVTVLAFLLLLGAVHVSLRRELRLRTAAQQVGARLQAAGRQQRAFVRLAGHELRTPLTSVQGYARQMLDEMDAGGALSPPRLRRAFQAIDLNAGRLARVVLLLQDALRLQQGTLSLERRPADVAEVVAGVLTTVEPRARAPAGGRPEGAGVGRGRRAAPGPGGAEPAGRGPALRPARVRRWRSACARRWRVR